MTTPRAERVVTESRAVDSRLLLAKFKSKQCNTSIIMCYAPTNYAPEDEYYEELQSVIHEIPERDMKIVIGDFNAEIGKINHGIENAMGVDGLGEVAYENGAHFISFCSANNLVIGSTLFQHKDIHKYTWISLCGNYENQRDHIPLNKERRRTKKYEQL
ncbi:craniofacial development protein 2-like [Palaemon carinicauda]|uniref:craniofacial development protein 2-like n=1 Tax=Palaemon carinicauda TaxID=392227 RepID=UPI0035B65A17